jgi:hypothetical protein
VSATSSDPPTDRFEPTRQPRGQLSSRSANARQITRAERMFGSFLPSSSSPSAGFIPAINQSISNQSAINQQSISNQ